MTNHLMLQKKDVFVTNQSKPLSKAVENYTDQNNKKRYWN